jgi:hypothetical protein
MSSVMKAMQAAHKHQRLKERIEEDAMLAQERADRAWRGDPKRKEQLLAARAAEAAAAEKPKAKKKAAPKKKTVAKKKSAAKKG